MAAVFVTWNAPRSAAKCAEKLRAQNEAANARRNQKFSIFNELMKTRGIRVTREAVEAFNLIDVVFKDSPKVKDAWAELISLYNRFEATPPALIDEKLLALLKEIAEDLSLAEQLRSADFERFYYPTAIAEEDRANGILSTTARMKSRHNLLGIVQRPNRPHRAGASLPAPRFGRGAQDKRSLQLQKGYFPKFSNRPEFKHPSKFHPSTTQPNQREIRIRPQLTHK